MYVPSTCVVCNVTSRDRRGRSRRRQTRGRSGGARARGPGGGRGGAVGAKTGAT